MEDLIEKYNVPVPRYTSYPTVPFWEMNEPDINGWESKVFNAFEIGREKGISLYIHLPYCESLCTYCGCNKRITTNHSVEEPYIDAVIKEWEMYVKILGTKPQIAELHLGGGTPTFFKPHNLDKLLKGIFEISEKSDVRNYGFEAHPNSTSKEHLEVLFKHGFDRLSLGIQDFDVDVQKIINRYQTYEQVEECIKTARKIGYKSINFDLVYGLPLQKLESIIYTVGLVNTLRPDRIAFYSYAHVPGIMAAQRKFTEDDLPSDSEKRLLYETGKSLLEVGEYVEIGMDHFALETDELYKAQMDQVLHRNFMGYTTLHCNLQIGLGVSAISDSWTAFAQNSKVVEDYLDLINNNELPIIKGHILTEDDMQRRTQILNLMCKGETKWDEKVISKEEMCKTDLLDQLESDGIIVSTKNGVEITVKGQPFIRNVCSAFDVRLWKSKLDKPTFSKSI